MSEQLVRPKIEGIINAYNRLFKSSQTLSKLKDAALGGRLLTPSDESFGVAGRSMAWKLFLCPSEPLNHFTPDALPSVSIESWRNFRKAYVNLLLEKMRAPDGSYEDGLVIPGVPSLRKRGRDSAGNLEKNNPLSLHDENPWNAWFAAVELRKTILQDVERTFPDHDYFRDPEVQSQLTNILFVYAAENPVLGYRQGMHELLAPILYAVNFDSIPDPPDENVDLTLTEYCSRTWVAADAYAIFVAMMKGVGDWYQWREGYTSSSSRSPPPTHAQFNAPSGQLDFKPYVAPIVNVCNRLQLVYLKNVDPELCRRMQAAGIEPQIYGIRWLRLLFTREFGLADSMVLWDGLFACDPTFDLAPWICVVMLIRIRNKLMPADYSEQLTYLLRYPPPTFTVLGSSSEMPSSSHHITLLLRQALSLQMAPTFATGAAVVYENRNLLNIPVEVPDPPLPPTRKQVIGERGKSSSSVESAFHRGGHNRHASNSMGLPEMFARGLLDRGESLGINKTVMNAVSELKRNLPDLASSFLPPSQPPSFQLIDEKLPAERPPWEPKTRFEMEREVSEGKVLRRKLGESVEWIIDALLQNEDDTDEENMKSVIEKKREALESLAYVRDVLKGKVTVVDDGQLFSAGELSKQRTKEKTESPAAGQIPVSPPTFDPWDRTTRPREPSSSQSLPKTSIMPSLNNNSRHSSQQSLASEHDRPIYTQSGLSRPPVLSGLIGNNSMTYPPKAEDKEQVPRRKVQQDPLGVITH